MSSSQTKGTLLPGQGPLAHGPQYLVLYLKHLEFYVNVLSAEPARSLLKDDQILRDVLVDGPARTLARMVFDTKSYEAAETLGKPARLRSDAGAVH